MAPLHNTRQMPTFHVVRPLLEQYAHVQSLHVLLVSNCHQGSSPDP